MYNVIIPCVNLQIGLIKQPIILATNYDTNCRLTLATRYYSKTSKERTDWGGASCPL